MNVFILAHMSALHDRFLLVQGSFSLDSIWFSFDIRRYDILLTYSPRLKRPEIQFDKVRFHLAMTGWCVHVLGRSLLDGR